MGHPTFTRRTTLAGLMGGAAIVGTAAAAPRRAWAAARPAASASDSVLTIDFDSALYTRLSRGGDALTADCVTSRRRRHIEAHLAARNTAKWVDSEEGRADALYAPYLDRQRREWNAVQRDSKISLRSVNYAVVPGLSTEMVERLSTAGPETLSQASRIAGITPEINVYRQAS